VSLTPTDGATLLGNRLADVVATEWTPESQPATIGLDIHAVGDRLYLLQLTCAA
jgi:hypothetical protein